MKIFIINGALIAIVVLIHYEVLRQLSIIIPRLAIRPRLRVLAGVFGTLCGHVVEIWVFGFAYYFLHHHDSFGSLMGNYHGSIMDSVYFSFACYTSLGFGDIEPIGDIRFLAGLEGLVGLLLITWSASFMFLEMTRYWRESPEQK
ncbi:MAG: ion channel [Cellvibrionaceae bacterium]